MHPGVIQTNLARHMNPFFGAILGAAGPLFLKSIAQGAATQVYVATNPAVAAVSGKYFADCNVTAPRADAEDEATARKLWELSERIASSVAQPAAA